MCKPKVIREVTKDYAHFCTIKSALELPVIYKTIIKEFKIFGCLKHGKCKPKHKVQNHKIDAKLKFASSEALKFNQ